MLAARFLASLYCFNPSVCMILYRKRNIGQVPAIRSLQSKFQERETTERGEGVELSKVDECANTIRRFQISTAKKVSTLNNFHRAGKCIA